MFNINFILFIAAAGIFVLENNIERLAVDHENAALLARGLSEIEELMVSPDSGETNIVFITIEKNDNELKNFMEINGILVSKGSFIRLVTNLNVTKDDIKHVISVFKDFYR